MSKLTKSHFNALKIWCSFFQKGMNNANKTVDNKLRTLKAGKVFYFHSPKGASKNYVDKQGGKGVSQCLRFYISLYI